jgi:hypothetical protein
MLCAVSYNVDVESEGCGDEGSEREGPFLRATKEGGNHDDVESRRKVFRLEYECRSEGGALKSWSGGCNEGKDS